MSRAPLMPLKVGDLLQSRYRLREPLGQGGMAEVWGATDKTNAKEVAIKILRKGLGAQSEIGLRMRREADLMNSLQSKHICKLLGSGEYQGRLFLVFERLRGESLEELLEREVSLPFLEVGTIVEGLLEGLTDAHRAGVIHRDLSPSNVFLEERKTGVLIRLLDFGISKWLSGDIRITREGATLGSFGYMAPEQAEAAHEVDERADIYAAATIAFQCLTGRLPFQAEEPYVALSIKTQVDPPSLAEVTGEQWPAALERFLKKSLARTPQDRFPSAFSALVAWRVLVARTKLTRTHRVEATPAAREDSRTETMNTAPPQVNQKPKKKGAP